MAGGDEGDKGYLLEEGHEGSNNNKEVSRCLPGTEGANSRDECSRVDAQGGRCACRQRLWYSEPWAASQWHLRTD